MPRRRRRQGDPYKPVGRPRKDGQIPLQTNPREVPEEGISLTVKQIRHMAGRGVPLEYIAVLAKVPIEEIQPGGRYAEQVKIGRGMAILRMGEAIYNRGIEGKTIDGLEWMRHNAKWKGAHGKGGADDEKEVGGIELEVVPTKAPKVPSDPSTKTKPPKGKRKTANGDPDPEETEVEDSGLGDPSPAPSPIQGHPRWPGRRQEPSGGGTPAGGAGSESE